MRVLLLEDHELPLIRGLALIRTGNLFDPSDKHGLSQVMADVLRSGGTKSKTGDQIDEELENIAASVEAGMDETSASVSFSGLKETTDQVLAVFKDVLTNPEFRQDKMDLTLTQYRSAIARRNDDAGDMPSRELTRILYGKDTPYGWQPEYADLARIHREDLIAFYQRYYFPKNIMLAVYGDFTAGGDEGQAGEAVRGLEGGAASRAAVPGGHRQARAGRLLRAQRRRDADVFLHRPPGRHAAGSRLSGARSRGQYPGRRLQQPAGFADPHAARLRVQHRRELGRELRLTRARSASAAARNP